MSKMSNGVNAKICPGCDELFNSQGDLIAHVRAEHIRSSLRNEKKIQMAIGDFLKDVVLMPTTSTATTIEPPRKCSSPKDGAILDPFLKAMIGVDLQNTMMELEEADKMAVEEAMNENTNTDANEPRQSSMRNDTTQSLKKPALLRFPFSLSAAAASGGVLLRFPTSSTVSFQNPAVDEERIATPASIAFSAETLTPSPPPIQQSPLDSSLLCYSFTTTAVDRPTRKKKCTRCGQRLVDSVVNLRDHGKLHIDSLKCNCCTETFKSHQDLLDHFELFHDELDPNMHAEDAWKIKANACFDRQLEDIVDACFKRNGKKASPSFRPSVDIEFIPPVVPDTDEIQHVSGTVPYPKRWTKKLRRKVRVHQKSSSYVSEIIHVEDD